MRVMKAWLLSFRIACLRLDVTWQQCLEMWLNRPAIVIVLEDRAQERQVLVGRINRMYPF